MQGGNNCVPKHLNMEVQKMKVFFLNCHIHSKAHPSPSASKDEAHVLLSYVIKWQTRCSTDVTGQLPIKLDFWSWAPASLSHRSSSSSGRAVVWATSKSCSYCAAKAGSMTTSGGARAGMATNSKLGSPISFLASQGRAFQSCSYFGQKCHSTEDSSFGWKTIDFALTFLSLISTLLPHNAIGIFSHTRTRSLCQLGTFL